MKLLNIVALALTSLACFVSAIPLRDNDNGILAYKITGVNSGVCDISGLSRKNLNAKEVVIPPYFELEGTRYYVRDILHNAFSNSNLETVTFNGGSRGIVTLEDGAFYNCKKLKTVNIYNPNLVLNSNAFNGCNPIQFNGWATRSLADKLVNGLVSQWKLEKKKGYDAASTEARNMKMKDLYNIAKLIRKNFRKGYECSSNLACSIHFRVISPRGIHMLLRELAIRVGISEYYILTGGDGSSVFWNYVRLDRDKWYDTWYNVEIYMFDFDKNGDDNYEKLFQTNTNFRKYLKDTLNHVIYDESIHDNAAAWYYYDRDARYGYPYEGRLNNKTPFNDYLLTLKKPGVRA